MTTEDRRKAKRGWVTRSVNELKALCEADPPPAPQHLRGALSNFTKRIKALDEIQALHEVELPPDQMDADIDTADEFRKTAYEAAYAAEALLEQILLPPEDDAPVQPEDGSMQGSAQGSATAVSAKLPKLVLPKYSGGAAEWQSFYDQFEAHIHLSDLPPISKFSYLKSLLQGDAERCIAGLAMTAENYQTAVDLLTTRFGRAELIRYTHIQSLLHIQPPHKCQGKRYVSQLWAFRDEIVKHLRSLEALGVEGEKSEVILTPIIVSRLPDQIRLEWARDGAGHEADLGYLQDFLESEITRIERSEMFKEKDPEEKEKNENKKTFFQSYKGKKKEEKVPSASALNSVSSVTPNCVFCSKGHSSSACDEILKLSVDDRKEKIKSHDICFRCLMKGHHAKGCSELCSHCKGFHHVITCYKYHGPLQSSDARKASSVSKKVNEVKHGSSTKVNDDNNVLMSNLSTFRDTDRKGTVLGTASVDVRCPDGSIKNTRILFDNGSDITYISSKCVKKVNPQFVTTEMIPYSSFGGHHSGTNSERNVYSVKLLSKIGQVHVILAAEIPVICRPLIRPAVPKEVLEKFGQLTLGEEYGNLREIEFDMIIGLDYYWEFLDPTEFMKIGKIVAMNSPFGFILTGAFNVKKDSKCTSSVQFLAIFSVTDNELATFWDLESVGILNDANQDNEMSPMLKKFNEVTQFKNGRYVVQMPFKNEDCKEKLGNNMKVALKCTESMYKRLGKDDKLFNDYREVFREYERLDIIEKVPHNELYPEHLFYVMPHRNVQKVESETTKNRPVFNCSSSAPNVLSLNDCLSTGPSLNPDLVEVILRFRRWPIVVSADITKAFLQICLSDKDKDLHRFFLLDEKGELQVWRFKRLPFGNTCSPFILNATIKLHLDKYEKSNTVTELSENMYVDNLLSGADTQTEAANLYCEARDILADANMPLTKLISNSTLITSQQNQVYAITKQGSNSVLGLTWNNALDTFIFSGIKIDCLEINFTKRFVLSCIARIFDPTGKISPFVMYCKILFQEIWQLGLDWDQDLPFHLAAKFEKWIKSSQVLCEMKITRSYFPDCKWHSLIDIELHAFCDGSEKGYGACIYIKAKFGNVFRTALVASKSRVAPIKRIKIPRIELLAAVLAARLLVFVYNALRLANRAKLFCWTDSTIALAWIQGDPNLRKPFVANRVIEIQTLTPPSSWFHIEGVNNPADLISRGALAEALVDNKLWLQGPDMLTEGKMNEKHQMYESTLEMKPQVSACHTVVKNSREIMELVEKFSSLNKILRIIAWVYRFVNNCKKLTKVNPTLTAEELSFAKKKVIKCVQRDAFYQEIADLESGKKVAHTSKLFKLNPMIDDEGMLRMHSRLELSELPFDTVYPLIIPNGHFSHLLIKAQHYLLYHAGVESLVSTLKGQYFIFGLRRTAKKVVNSCMRCKRHDSRPCNQAAAPLPAQRIQSAPPFSHTGLDYAGPVFTSDYPGKKLYILLFTCAVTRAVHLELTDSMNLQDCMLAVRRFIGRRGMPTKFQSDNAKTFISAAQELTNIYGMTAPQWDYITPRSPWWGGYWERLVKSVKLAMKKTLGVSSITKGEMITLLVEIEACINSRPLFYVSDESVEYKTLSPSHFLLGRDAFMKSNVSFESISVNSSDLYLKHKAMNNMFKRFWSLWSKDYLSSLPSVVKKFKQKCNLKLGSVVLIREENIPRLQWPLGLVIEILPSKDNLTRSVKIKTAKGIVQRPVQKLHDLEVQSTSVIDQIDEIIHDKNDVTTVIDISDDVDKLEDKNVDVKDVDQNSYRTRFGRTIRNPDRY